MNGGHWPHWNRTGDRLYYVERESLMEVEISTTPALRLGQPTRLFEREPLGWPLIFGWPPGFDVSPDGERFVINQATDRGEARTGIVVVENWLSEFLPGP